MKRNAKSKYENLKIIYNRSKLGWYNAPLFIAFWFVLFYLVVLPSYHYYPETLSIDNDDDTTTTTTTTTARTTQEGQFIGERAKNILMRLTKIGPRVMGSAANEQAAREFLLAELRKISVDVRDDLYDLDIDVQISSGNYILGKMINAYQSIQNVVVKLTPKFSNSTESLLINSHYDTVPGSPGAGDDGIMVAIMLETLHVLVRDEQPPRHAIVFLFNGAEESPLQGSHAFITQHKWAKNVKAFINLDSCGNGGRDILFQAGPQHSWLIKYYASFIQHPFASTLAEELFQHGFIPSDTDFRIFRDFGQIPGLDLAHTYNGYVYHTKHDRFNLIPPGTYQLTGENVLALVRGLANAPELEDDTKERAADGHAVFYDVLGWFMIYYPEYIGFIVNITICVVAIITILVYIWNMAHQTGMFRRRIFAKFAILLGIQVTAVVLSVTLTIAIALFVDAVGLSMAWFNHTWIIFGLYFCPMFFVLGIIPAIYFSRTKDHGLPVGYGIQIIMHSHCLILAVFAIILTVLAVRSSFVLVISVAFYTISVILNIFTCFHKRTFLWLIPHLLGQLLPYLFYTYLIYAFYVVLIPMQGRTGVDHNPEIFIAMFAAIACLLFAPYLVVLFSLFRKSKLIISIFGLICVAFLILIATPMGFPYAEKESPQRFYAVHTVRNFHNFDADMSVRRTDSGYFVVPLDRHPESVGYVFEKMNVTASNRTDCETELMCGYPLFNNRWLRWSEHSLWIPGPEPNPHGWPTLRIRAKQRMSSTSILFSLEVSGPDHISIFIQPLADTKLTDWSFNQPLYKTTSPPYLVYFPYALDPTPLIFHMEFEHDSSDWFGGTFDIAIIGHKIHDDIYKTDEFREFLAAFPKWCDVTSWTSSYNSWRL